LTFFRVAIMPAFSNYGLTVTLVNVAVQLVALL
jgi:hypothetical protein